MVMELEAGSPRRPVQITSRTGVPRVVRRVADVPGRPATRSLAARAAAQKERKSSTGIKRKEAEKSRCVITGVAVDTSGVFGQYCMHTWGGAGPDLHQYKTS